MRVERELGACGAAWLFVAMLSVGCSAGADDGAGGTDGASSSGGSSGSGSGSTSSAPTTGPDTGATSSSAGATGTSGEASSGGDSVTTGGDEDSSTGGEAGCGSFPEVEDFAASGSFTTMTEPGGTTCTIARPTTLGEAGRLHPVLLWGNGTTANPFIYNQVLSHWASHGFIVAAANTSNAGDGTDMLACLEWLTAQHNDPTSAYAGAVDLERVGASGHSQGGGGALMVGADPRVSVTAPLQPYTEQDFGGYDQASQSAQTGPMFLMSGALDTIASPMPNQQRVFDDANLPVFWGTLAGADHVIAAIGNISGFRGPSTAWFRLHLMCDESARPLFYDACTLCEDPDWDAQTANW